MNTEPERVVSARGDVSGLLTSCALTSVVVITMSMLAAVISVDRLVTLQIMASALGLSGLMIGACVWWDAIRLRHGNFTAAVPLLLSLMAWYLSGWVSWRYGVAVKLPLRVVGFLGIGAALWRWWRVAATQRLGLTIAGCVLGVFGSAVYWGSGFLHPSLHEALRAGLGAHRDELYHLAITNSLLTYELPSTMLDGTPLLRYHLASHYLWAAVSSITGTRPVISIPVAAPLLICTFLLLAYSELVRQLRFVRTGHDSSVLNDWRLFALVVVAFIGVIPSKLATEIGASFVTPLVSESHALAVAIGACACALALSHWRRWRDAERETVASALVLLMFCAAVWLAGYTKISIGGLFILSTGWAWLRLPRYRRVVPSAMLAILVVGFVAVAKYAVGPSGSTEPFLSASRTANELLRVVLMFNLIILYGWTLVFVAWSLRSEKVTTVDDVWKALRDRSLLDVEFLLVFAAGGIAPTLLIDTRAGALYFADFQRWLAVAMIGAVLLARPMPWLDSLRSRSALKIYNIPFLLLALGPVAAMAFNVGLPLRRAFALRHDVAAASEIAAGDSGREVQSVMRVLDSLATLPRQVRRDLRLQIPNAVALRLLPPTADCWASAFVGPAVSGVASLNGLPPARTCHSADFGFESYPLSNRQRADGLISLDSSCARSKSEHFSTVVNTQLVNHLVRTTSSSCQ
jgi:hypothetical protein